MIGFPFAPDYLNSLKLGTPSEDVVPVRRKVAKSGKPNFFPKAVNSEAKAKTTKSIKSRAVKPSLNKSSSFAAIPKRKQPILKPSHYTSEHYVAEKFLPQSNAASVTERKFHSCGTSPSVLRFANCRYSLLMTLSEWEVKAISGFCTVSLLKGSASVNGYALKTAVGTEIINPSWLPTVKLCHEITSSSSSASKCKSSLETIKSILNDSGLSIKNNVGDSDFVEWINDAECIILIQGIPRDSQEWLVAAEDQSIYRGFSDTENFDDHAMHDISCRNPQSGHWWSDVRTCGVDDVFSVTSAVVGDQYNLSRLASIELLDYSSCWIDSISGIIEESSVQGCRGSRSVLCGAKGVGKSTCLRFTVNRLLSTTDSVAVIDCDLGQPEFTAPGLLSLHIITGPILSPTHMHLKEPLLSYFIGDITSKNEPEQFSNALRALMARYTEIQSDLLTKDIQLTKRNQSDANSFAMLSDRKFKPKMVPLPLVVNTDGNVRFMGAEILTAVMEIVRPTHVLHISTEKDRDLPAVERLKGVNTATSSFSAHNGHSDQYDLNSNHVNTYMQQTRTSSSNSNINKRKVNDSSSSDDCQTEGISGCRVFTLAPGRTRPSKIASADLRTLRIVSYFLRGESSLRNRVRPPLPPIIRQKVAPLDNTYMPKPPTSSPDRSGYSLGDNAASDGHNTLDQIAVAEGCYDGGSCGVDIEIKSSKKTQGAVTPSGFFITKGAIVDFKGILALTVMRLPPLGVHFSEVVFEVLSMSVVPRLILAAMNASLVGIVSSPLLGNSSDSVKRVTLSSSAGNRYRGDTIEDAVIACKVIQGNHLYENEVIESGIVDPGEFEIQYRIGDGSAGVGSLPECIGLGIVRAIDVQKQLLYVITPLLPEILNNRKCGISLVRGPLQLPGVMTYAPDVMPLHPYLSSEITGEGSATMKTRNNLKRRSLQNN